MQARPPKPSPTALALACSLILAETPPPTFLKLASKLPPTMRLHALAPPHTLLPARARCGRLVLQDPAALRLRSGLLSGPAFCSLLARANESFDCLALEGSAPCGHTVAAGSGGGTAGPAGPPGSLIAVCVAGVCGPSVRPGKSLAFCFFWNARSAQTRRGERAGFPG
jgi:hypothetical protein